MNDFLVYAAAFAVLLGLLIVVHEFGHFAVARWAGVKVLRFSVGFGRPIFLARIGRDRTEWAIGVFPLGGYVRMLDESEGEVAPQELHRSFNRQSVWKRMAIVVAGPLANLLLAVVVYWGLFLHGTEELRPILGVPAVQSPAATAGIENGERVLRIGDQPVETWSEMRWVLLRKLVEQDSVELEVINPRNEISFRRLDLTAARSAEVGRDPLESLGITFFRPVIPPVVGKTTPGSAAAAAGLVPGDRIVGIDGTAIVAWADVVRIVRSSPGIPLVFRFQRGTELREASITPAAVSVDGKAIGRIGAAVDERELSRNDVLVTVRYAVFPALNKALEETWDKAIFSLQMMGKMVTGVLSWRNISGPLTIADYAGQSAKLGAGHFLRFLALVSISLAVLNLLPVPILDGGHLLYYFAEILRGRPLSEQCMMIGQKIGLALILMLTAFALFNDITRLIPG